jgi:hypothetical protein
MSVICEQKSCQFPKIRILGAAHNHAGQRLKLPAKTASFGGF